MALAKLPQASPLLRRKARAPRCETPGQEDLTVPQLENERDCYMGAEYRVRSKHNRLIDSINQSQTAIARLAASKPKRGIWSQ